MNISKQHCFYYSAASNGHIISKRTVGDENSELQQRIYNFKVTATEEEKNRWKMNIKNSFPSKDKKPGVSDIKQVELYTKWRGCIPLEFQEEMCPKPADVVLEKIKVEKQNKYKKRIAKQKATRENESRQQEQSELKKL